MLKRGSVLRTTADFDNAIMFQLNVEVFQLSGPIDPGGIIETHTEDSVTIGDGKFIKANCQFIVR